MTGDVRERIDPGLDLKMEQNGALERFLVVVFFFFLFLFLPKPQTEALWGERGSVLSPTPFLHQNHLSRPREYTNCCLCLWCMLG